MEIATEKRVFLLKIHAAKPTILDKKIERSSPA
jgi:hypothetical protein